ALGQDLVPGVVVEEEGVEDVVLGAFELLLGEGFGVESGDFGKGCPGGVDCGYAFGEHFNAEVAGVVVGEAEAAAYGISERSLGANLDKEPAAEAAAEDLVHDRECGYI